MSCTFCGIGGHNQRTCFERVRCKHCGAVNGLTYYRRRNFRARWPEKTDFFQIKTKAIVDEGLCDWCSAIDAPAQATFGKKKAKCGDCGSNGPLCGIKIRIKDKVVLMPMCT